jgi:gliding motility-associated-like protein
VRVDFFSTLTAGSRLEAVGFDFSKPPLAQAVIAEVFPRQVAAAVETTFSYFVRPTLGEEDWGFDSLEIETFVRPSQVRSVRILSDTVVEVDLGEYPPELLEDRLVVHFPRFTGRKGASDTGKVLEVVFAAMVVKYGTEFRGRVFDQHSEEVYQLVEGGDATNLYSGEGVVVTMPFADRIISSVEVRPALFTPNGDGRNDQVRIAYALLNLTEETAVRLVIYDLSGRRVRQVQRGRLVSGRYEWVWDGQADDGAWVPPGTYLYQVAVETDQRNEYHCGILGIAY